MEKAIPEKQSPFATEPVGRLIVRFAVPSVIALLVNSLYNIVDQIFIGWGVGYLGNGATNVVFPITIIALALAMMIGNGVPEPEAGRAADSCSEKRCRKRHCAGNNREYCIGSHFPGMD